MARVIGTPPLGRLPLAVVVMAHAAGAWGLVGSGREVVIDRPPEIRLALAAGAPAMPTVVPSMPAAEAPPTPEPPKPQPEPTSAPVAPPPKAERAQPVAVKPKPAPAAKPVPEQPAAAEPDLANADTPPDQPQAPAPAATAGEAPLQNAAVPSVSGGPDAPLIPASFSADYLNNPRPAYPRISRRLGEQGEVRLLVRVDAMGCAKAVHVDVSSGHPRLDGAAVEAVRNWRFVPAHRGGAAVPSEVRVPITFALEDAT